MTREDNHKNIKQRLNVSQGVGAIVSLKIISCEVPTCLAICKVKSGFCILGNETQYYYG